MGCSNIQHTQRIQILKVYVFQNLKPILKYSLSKRLRFKWETSVEIESYISYSILYLFKESGFGLKFEFLFSKIMYDTKNQNLLIYNQICCIF